MGDSEGSDKEFIDRLVSEGDMAINEAMRASGSERLGVLDSGFLTQSVGLLPTGAAVCISMTDTISAAVEKMRKNHIGCILVVASSGKLAGVFTDRDCLTKVLLRGMDLNTTHVSEVMTYNPTTIGFTASMGYALSLMCMGGFRHLPIVDSDLYPVGVISVKDIVLYITTQFVEDIMKFEA